MKKIFLLLPLAAVCLSAGAQEPDHWNTAHVNHIDFMYNYSFQTPEGMSASGWGLDFPLYEIQFTTNNGDSQFTFGVVDFNFDFNFLKKGNLFDDDGTIFTPPASYSKTEAVLTAIGITVPVGYTHRFGDSWGASVSVAPGIDLGRYRNSFTYDEIRHDDDFYKTTGRMGFRLDAKLSVWYEGVGLVVRYRPFSYLNQTLHTQSGLLSAGVTLRY